MTEINQAAINRGKDKVTGETFYSVKSDTQENTWYTVRFDHSRLAWCCDCPARCSGCKHNRAVQEVLKVRRARIAAEMGGDMPAIVAETQAREDKKIETSQRGHLNGSSQGFSLLK
jgi:methylmalonyl-CoA mutase N-terminal domain/subunit